MLLGSLLFRIKTTSEQETALLAVPQHCADGIIALYHTSVFAGHQCMIKTYLIMNNKFLIPGLIHYLGSYIKDCDICQLNRNEKSQPRQLQQRINLKKNQTIVHNEYGSESYA